MKKLLSLIIIAGLAFPTISHAQDTTKPAKSKMERRKAMKKRWDNATPEEKEKMKEKSKQAKAKYDSLPPEKKQELKDKMKARRERRNG